MSEDRLGFFDLDGNSLVTKTPADLLDGNKLHNGSADQISALQGNGITGSHRGIVVGNHVGSNDKLLTKVTHQVIAAQLLACGDLDINNIGIVAVDFVGDQVGNAVLGQNTVVLDSSAVLKSAIGLGEFQGTNLAEFTIVFVSLLILWTIIHRYCHNPNRGF